LKNKSSPKLGIWLGLGPIQKTLGLILCTCMPIYTHTEFPMHFLRNVKVIAPSMVAYHICFSHIPITVSIYYPWLFNYGCESITKDEVVGSFLFFLNESFILALTYAQNNNLDVSDLYQCMWNIHQ
jgi:hypothetical protein